MQRSQIHRRASTYPAQPFAASRPRNRRSQAWPAITPYGRGHRAFNVASMSEHASSSAPLVYVVMGVSGCGKSTVGALLADRLHCPFYDADNYHPEANIRKMSAGIPLTDEDRWPWLQQLAGLLRQHVQQSHHAVLACSALKPAYRQVLRSAALPDQQQPAAAAPAVAGTHAAQVSWQEGKQQATTGSAEARSAPVVDRQQQQLQSPIAFVLLNPTREQLLQRVQLRAATGKHFMPPSLLDDQLKQLSYDPAELYMCFGAGCGSSSSEVSGSSSQSYIQGGTNDVDGLCSAERSHSCPGLPSAEQIVDAIMSKADD